MPLIIPRGRTTRMLEEAKELARQGNAVYVLAATRDHAKILEHMAGEDGQQFGFKYETPDSLRTFDWRTMKLIGSHPNCVVVVDHYTIEKHFAAMLAVLHRYDVASDEWFPL